MNTMFKTVCPICDGDVVSNRDTKLYLCLQCHVEHAAKDLKLVPIKEAQDANPFKS